jgi:hypothetical protein
MSELALQLVDFVGLGGRRQLGRQMARRRRGIHLARLGLVVQAA